MYLTLKDNQRAVYYTSESELAYIHHIVDYVAVHTTYCVLLTSTGMHSMAAETLTAENQEIFEKISLEKCSKIEVIDLRKVQTSNVNL